MQSAGSLGRFLGPMIGFALVSFDAVEHYARTSFFASAAILLVAMLCVVAVRPAPRVEGEAVAA
jgi:hypothetical protein